MKKIVIDSPFLAVDAVVLTPTRPNLSLYLDHIVHNPLSSIMKQYRDAPILDVAAPWDETITSSLLSLLYTNVYLWININYEKLQ